MTDDSPKIQIDSDWKAEAQREKERLAEQARARREQDAATAASKPAATAGSRAPRELPPANFDTLMAQIATQALMYTGAIADPRTGQPVLNLDLARHHIDMLNVLEEKTAGNLTDQEARALATTLYELRGRYVQVANAARQKG